MRKIAWHEYPGLIWLNLTVKMRNFTEFCRIVFKYYPNAEFRRVDLALLRQYFWRSPYTISKNFLIERGETDIYAYGETPLTTLEKISKECGITKDDVVYELGCGRGRGCFWLKYFIGCQVIGIEYIPAFVQKAQKVQNRYSVEDVEFLLKDMLKAHYADATVIYLYGTCYEDDFIEMLLKKFEKLPNGTKLITVSYPLTDYVDSTQFEVVKSFPAPFTWGDADVYLHIKK